MSTVMSTVEMSLPEPEKSKGEKMWARVLRASRSPRCQGGPQGDGLRSRLSALLR